MGLRLGMWAWLAGLSVLGMTALAGCTASPSGHPERNREASPEWDREAQPRTKHDVGGSRLPGFRLELPRGVKVQDGGAPSAAEQPDKDGCVELTRMAGKTEDEFLFSWSSTSPQCEIDEAVNKKPINGKYPTYRTAADIPSAVAKNAHRVRTPLGMALVFTQRYTTYTQSRNDYDVPFAVITLDKPAHPDHPTLVFTSALADLTEEELTQVVTEDLEPR